MKYLSTSQTVKEQELVGLGGKLLGLDPPCDTAESLRDRLIELVSVGNLRHRPEALFACHVSAIFLTSFYHSLHR